jgi:GNAT superfamily N-acetyltransferase
MPSADERLVAAADRSFIVSFEKLVDLRPEAELRRFGSVVAWDTRIPMRSFNGVAVLKPAAPDDIEAAIDWIAARRIPHAAWLREDLADAARPTFAVRRYERLEWPEPVMAIRPPATPPPLPEGVAIREVTDAAGLGDHVRTTVDDGGFPEEAATMLYVPAFLADDDTRLFTAYVDDRPVGTSIAIRSGDDVSGVYAVGVAPSMRGRGIGTAVTWAAVEAGRDWGCTLVVLQSSDMGFAVYRRMGFDVLTHYEMHRPPA